VESFYEPLEIESGIKAATDMIYVAFKMGADKVSFEALDWPHMHTGGYVSCVLQ